MSVGAPCRVLLAAALFALGPLAAASTLRPFTATYEIGHGSKRIGVSSVSLRTGEGDTWVLESRTEPRGIAKLVVGSIVETSVFELRDATLRPQRFDAQESRGKGSQKVAFDWERGIAHSEHDGVQAEIDLRPRTLDHSLVQIALMLDVAHGNALRPYFLVEKNELRTYGYEAAGEELVETPAGAFRTTRVRQHREGSSREMWFWLAPDLDFLAVRIEQRKDGETTFTMSLTAPPARPVE